MADGEWPIALQQPEPSGDPEHEQYQADRGSDKDLPGGKKQHERRTKAALRRVGAIWAVAREQTTNKKEH